MTQSSVTKHFRGLAGILALLVAWQIGVLLTGVESFFFPTPIDVAGTLYELAYKGILESYIFDSLYRYFAALLIASLLGIAIGFLLWSSRIIYDVFHPFVRFAYALVEVAWIPILIIWLGFGFKTVVIAVSYVIIWPMIDNTIVGLGNLSARYRNAALSLGASHMQILRHVLLPGILPNIFTGLRVAAGFAFRALILGEIVAAKSGMGYLMFDSARNLQTDRTIAAMIVMGVLWLMIDRLLLVPVEQTTVNRWGAGSRG